MAFASGERRAVRTAENPPGNRASADQAFADLADRYLDGLFRFEPARATALGLHQYDAELPAYSRQDIEREIFRSKSALRRLRRIPKGSLTAANRFDARLLESSIRGHLHDLEAIRMWEKDPNFYTEAISRGLFVLVQRDFAPMELRLKSLISRARQVPTILAQARANLTNPPAIYTRIAVRQVTSQIQFLKNDLPKAVAGASDLALVSEFQEVNRKAIEEYEKFLEFLKSDLAPRSHGDFALGAENFRRKLLYDEMVSTPLTRLLRLGDAELRKTQSAFQETAALIDSARPAAEVFKDLADDHPPAEELLAETQATLAGLRKFVVSHEIVGIPSPADPRVVESPPFMRALTFASMDTPGPFELASTEAFFNVTLPDAGWSDTQKHEHLRFFSRYGLRNLSVHEVFPGHYTQFLWVNAVPSKVRRVLGSDSNSEGWAHYAEQMMLEEGYGEGDPKLLLMQLQAALVRLGRYLVGIRLHTQGMTLEEGTRFFQQEAYLDRVNAEREATRGAFDPTYLVYTLGKRQILKLREDYKNKVGDQFRLKEFHEEFLRFGYPPIPLIREAMLGDDSPTL
jgi:uncharacterized protein (DUF885 family)